MLVYVIRIHIISIKYKFIIVTLVVMVQSYAHTYIVCRFIIIYINNGTLINQYGERTLIHLNKIFSPISEYLLTPHDINVYERKICKKIILHK